MRQFNLGDRVTFFTSKSNEEQFGTIGAEDSKEGWVVVNADNGQTFRTQEWKLLKITESYYERSSDAYKGALDGLYYDESTDTLAMVHNGIVEAYSPKENFFVDSNTNGWFRMYMPPAAILGFQYIGEL